jgi:hypothetical protein
MGCLEIADTTTTSGSRDGDVDGAGGDILSNANFLRVIFADVARAAPTG